MRMIYLDCSAGIAGDMLLAALIDVGASLDYVRAGLGQLPLTESWELRVERTMRRGISAQRAIVTINGELADTSFQEEEGEVHRHHSHGHNHEHSHETPHHHAHEHAHTHRPYAEIKRILDTTTLGISLSLAPAPCPTRLTVRSGIGPTRRHKPRTNAAPVGVTNSPLISVW